MSVVIEDRRIPGPHGEIPLRLYTPDSAPPTVNLVWAHGGAFAVGDLDMPESDWVARQLADRGIRVVAVDYRLAPVPRSLAVQLEGQHGGDTGSHYPVASEEVTAVFSWAVHAFGGTWALGGASAGADLAAGATLRLRDAGGRLPAGLLLAYPIVHAELPPLTAELAHQAASLPGRSAFPPDTVLAMNLNYVRDPALLREPYAFPGGHDLTGLPPVFIVNSDADTLRASGQQFAAELALAGTDVTVVREKGTQHGHLNLPDDPAATRSIARMATWLLSPTLN
ncbi:alpha/beta hydrolase fold domain-containing protein [Kineosporia sp. J2-2]|uniref:Alpha/beta hydrolase fold domain-containing protein n=1 Tax=Kineosporia corallincola TaxID=2835133 RepID=A0ABS5TCC4_9ACTN|nr:alpha/beta hydrolase fold domain-containing protein [Kineosporia corallincola]MBT0768715.1 alpha/beta hydrolase fold domain-containing protein [Kineosporia corallincola]